MIKNKKKRLVVDLDSFNVLLAHRVNHIISTLDQINPTTTRKLTTETIHSQLHLVINMAQALDITIHNFSNEYYSRKEQN